VLNVSRPKPEQGDIQLKIRKTSPSSTTCVSVLCSFFPLKPTRVGVGNKKKKSKIIFLLFTLTFDRLSAGKQLVVGFVGFYRKRICELFWEVIRIQSIFHTLCDAIRDFKMHETKFVIPHLCVVGSF